MMNGGAPTVVVATAPQPGAVAIVQLHGAGSATLLAKLTGDERLAPGRLRLRAIAGIDEAVVAALREDWCQVMPHGGPRVVRKLVDRLLELGAVYEAAPDAAAVFPEADSPIEADVLATMARAASPAAIDLLAAQPGLWRAAGKAGREAMDVEAVMRRSAVLDRLIDPPTVVVVGRPNVGKSTLTNAMLGRAVSLVADLPGTTRDWVAGVAELSHVRSAMCDVRCESAIAHRTSHIEHAYVAVKWLDTPGLRGNADVVEQEAIALARQVIAAADVLIAMRDPQIDWPDVAALPRSPDLYVVGKMDDCEGVSGSGASPGTPLAISAKADRGLDRLQSLILAALGLPLEVVETPGLWAFSRALRAAMGDDGGGLRGCYVGGAW